MTSWPGHGLFHLVHKSIQRLPIFWAFSVIRFWLVWLLLLQERRAGASAIQPPSTVLRAAALTYILQTTFTSGHLLQRAPDLFLCSFIYFFFWGCSPCKNHTGFVNTWFPSPWCWASWCESVGASEADLQFCLPSLNDTATTERKPVWAYVLAFTRDGGVGGGLALSQQSQGGK